jgi:lysyl-tRNA synthetase class 1
MDEWLTYAATESLQYFMFQKPKTAKRLYFDVIPKAVDEYHQQLRAYADQDVAQKLANPVFHIHGHNVPASNMVVSFAMLLNLASVAHAEDKAALWGFIRRYAPDASPRRIPISTRRPVSRCATTTIS